MKHFICWTADLKWSKLWSSQLWTQFKELHIEAWKSQNFNGVQTRDLAIPVRRSNQLSYEATDVGSWSFVSRNEPVRNEFEVVYKKFSTSVASLLSWLERRTGIARSRVESPLKSWFFQASIRNCLNCVHNCADHGLLDFNAFNLHYTFTLHTFFRVRVLHLKCIVKIFNWNMFPEKLV